MSTATGRPAKLIRATPEKLKHYFGELFSEVGLRVGKPLGAGDRMPFSFQRVKVADEMIATDLKSHLATGQ